MTAIDQSHVTALLAEAADLTTSTTQRGRALESLAAYLFSAIPGVDVKASDHLAAFKAEEIDVALWNEQDAEGLIGFDKIILIECKNWDTKVGALEVAWFDTKLRVRSRQVGILIALNGITGDPYQRTAASRIIERAVGEGRAILVLMKDDLTALTDSDQLVALLKDRELQLNLDLALP